MSAEEDSASRANAPVDRRFEPRLGVAIVGAVSTMFASNHVAARLAFDHGASVATGVTARAAGTALVLFLMIKAQRVPLSVPRALAGKALVTALLIAVQSYCLYSAVARIPVALALLCFQTSPLLYVLLAWAMGKEKPGPVVFGAMLAALGGLSLALGIAGGAAGARWSEIRGGVLWAFSGAIAFALVLYSNAHSLKQIDGRVRTFVMMAVTAIVMLAGGAASHGLVLPGDGTGWLGLALLTGFYCTAMCVLFILLPRLHASSTVALNFEPIALLGLGWLVLGQAVTPVQVCGAFLTVGAIVWLGLAKR